MPKIRPMAPAKVADNNIVEKLTTREKSNNELAMAEIAQPRVMPIAPPNKLSTNDSNIN
jgi:hypothetical protein